MARKAPSLRIALPVVIAALVLALAPTALAGKGGGHAGTGGGSISLVLLNGDTAPHYGGQVTFNVSTAATDKPMVSLDCFQSGVKVYWASAGFYSGYPWQWARNFTLASSNWTGGAADCTATLYYWNGKSTQNLASLSFHANA